MLELCNYIFYMGQQLDVFPKLCILNIVVLMNCWHLSLRFYVYGSL